MASPSVEQRIERELSKRGTCSFLDLKSALKLSRGDIEANTERLAHRGLVKIKKDADRKHTYYTWVGPKEEARVPDHARPKKAKGKQTAPPGVPLEGRERGGGTIAKKKQPASPESLPLDWKQRLEQSISGYSRHPKEKNLMFKWLRNDFLRKDALDEAAGIIWNASRKRRWNIEDPPDFFEHFKYLLLSLAISVTTPDPPLTAKALQAEVETLEKLREDEPFLREGEAGEKLERKINIFTHRAEIASITRPKTPGRRVALQFLLQYLRDVLEMKQPHQAARLLIYIGHGVKWSANTTKSRACELAKGKDASVLNKMTAANLTKKERAVLDNLNGEAYETALEKMSPKQRKSYRMKT